MKPISHYQLTAELISDENGQFVSLEQQDPYSNDPVSIYADAWQLKAILEQFGVVAADIEAAKTIATLERRLLVLRDRIDHLHEYLVNHSDHKHADLSYEVTYATATANIAEEFCYDLEEVPTPAPAVPVPCKPAPDANSKQQTIDF
jgi:hypothetical protein